MHEHQYKNNNNMKIFSDKLSFLKYFLQVHTAHNFFVFLFYPEGTLCPTTSVIDNLVVSSTMSTIDLHSYFCVCFYFQNTFLYSPRHACPGGWKVWGCSVTGVTMLLTCVYLECPKLSVRIEVCQRACKDITVRWQTSYLNFCKIVIYFN